MTTSATLGKLTHYDTGARLEPQLWPANDDPDRLGRVDFDDDEGATIASAYVQRLPSGAYALCVTRVSDVRLVVGAAVCTREETPGASASGVSLFAHQQRSRHRLRAGLLGDARLQCSESLRLAQVAVDLFDAELAEQVLDQRIPVSSPQCRDLRLQ